MRFPAHPGAGAPNPPGSGRPGGTARSADAADASDSIAKEAQSIRRSVMVTLVRLKSLQGLFNLGQHLFRFRLIHSAKNRRTATQPKFLAPSFHIPTIEDKLQTFFCLAFRSGRRLAEQWHHAVAELV